MFVILLKYIKPMEMVDQYLMEHRDFLEKGYQQDYFVVSGPRHPRDGGVIISQLKDRNKLDSILKEDPFWINKIAQYEIIEFNPVKFHPDFSKYI